jgi:class 3 adenylate cyclase
MAITDILDSLDEEIKIIHDSDFEIEVIETRYVPNFDDSSLTFENFDTKKKKVKTIETCVLYIDIRKSTKLNLQHYPTTMAKLYSSFVRSMIKAAEYYNGKVRNIVGDRVMVVYDTDNCFTNAVNTAILMNTISQKIINKRFKNNAFTCGIGIDYGKMMVTKCGTIKQGSENANYKSLVWLGKPANIASKLTDSANKTATSYTKEGIQVGLHYPNINDWSWSFKTPKEFVDNLKITYSPTLIYKDEYFSSCFSTSKTYTNYDSTPPILISESVYNGFKKANPDDNSIKEKMWKIKSRKIPDYSGKLYGGDITFTW